ncbi:SPT2 -like [Asbolus verrucosus]|uniref:Protein SPT2 homolog n=1 Tax=Asbolus verrucosus TaxID=1661398 RepID=A0A482VWU1_ASBVE|nr:SPT2 -like [Asbolus verrucosus]
MDFGTLLHAAQKNEKTGKKEGVRYYSTKFEPPKKEQRNKQQLSANIKKFLAKKEAEERQKLLEANKKREELLALRAKDKKATRRVNVMLKRTKSANQSVLQDAVDANNTSVTLAGPIQPDEDDYGYVSQEATAFYNKMIEKYNKMPEEPKFSLGKKKKVSTDLNSTRERVKAALEREKEEANMPHRRKRKHREEPDEIEQQQEDTPRPKPKAAAPPPLNFNELLKLAEKKQFEPVVIEQKPKEEERLFTKKQKKEMEREKEWRDRKEGKLPPLDKGPPPNKIPKVNTEKIVKLNGDAKTLKANESVRKIDKTDMMKKNQLITSKKIPEMNKRVNLSKTPSLEEKKTNRENVPLPNARPGASSSKINGLNKPKDLNDVRRKELGKTREFPQSKRTSPGDIKPKQFPPKDLKPKQFPPPDVRPKQVAPPDVRKKEFPPWDVKRKPAVNKRRILDDEEYDSEMDDFIDDGPEEEEDYSKYISEIFGYDKSRYRNMDDDVDNMESSFAQQMREEVISTKIGIMEDLEDMKKEEEEKRRKALMKKRKL